jgi:protocatechuate 3,4-dioxygenase beta subunit
LALSRLFIQEPKTKMNKKLIGGATLLAIACIAQLGMVAAQITKQNNTAAAIHGNVTDPSGAVIPGAMVTISSSQFNRTVSSDDAGQYSISGLTPGHYRVRVHFGGFAAFDRNNFLVTDGRETEVNAQLELREVHQTVSVFEQ